MGAGLAKQFRDRGYANGDYYSHYKMLCINKVQRLGHCTYYVLDQSRTKRPWIIINFPSKDHWKDKSTLENISATLRHLVGLCHTLGIKSLALPPVGAGLGGLDYVAVKTLVFLHFNLERDILVHFYGNSSLRPTPSSSGT
jgi:O-acetyl-ADP-ribose deacetylase (regulator of RNase III)